jgi:hypothetical protein
MYDIGLLGLWCTFKGQLHYFDNRNIVLKSWTRRDSTVIFAI